jgi:predicted dehydrogenase
MGLVGPGFVGAHHIDAVRRLGFVDVVAIAASTESSARRKADALGVPRAYASYDALAADPDVQVVHNTTPNYLHVPVIMAALSHKKHVISDKPLATSADDARRLLDAANAAGVVHAVTFNYRGNPLVQQAREMIAGGELGPLHFIHGAYLQDWLLEATDFSWRLEPEKGGESSAVADIGSHWCDLAQFISGHRITTLSARLLTAMPERVRAEGRRAFAPADGGGESRAVTTEDAAAVHFETREGALGSVTVSQISPGRKNKLWIELDGAEEALAFDQENPEELWRGRREAATIIRRDPESLSAPAARFATLPPGHPQGYADCFDAFVADVYDAIATGTAPDGLPTFEDGLRATQITDAVLASADSGRWVDVAGATEPEVLAR